jgi:predicted phosphate transport protein (TIGR00153 family)
MHEGIMFLEKILSHGKRERQVTEDIREHIKLLCTACEVFVTALEKQDRNLMMDVIELEREGDAIRREVISHIYEGAFLPYLRPDLCKFVELVDEVFGLLKDTVSYYLEAGLPAKLKDDSSRVALLNQRMCEMLLITFEAMLRGEDLREKIFAIRIYEKKIDDIKFSLMSDAHEVPIENFWKGKVLSDLLSSLTWISDMIEDASDHLQIIHLGTR